MIRLRPANLNDISMLQHWDEQIHNIESDPNDDWNWEVELQRQPPWREQLVAELDGRPIGFVQIIDPKAEDSHYWGEVEPHLRALDIWLGEPSDLGKGYGTTIMHLVISRCFQDADVKAIIIDPLVSNTKAIRFYQRLGFQRIERRMFGEDDCYVYRLERSYLQVKNGPL